MSNRASDFTVALKRSRRPSLTSPVLPYINESASERGFFDAVKPLFDAAVLRCGFAAEGFCFARSPKSRVRTIALGCTRKGSGNIFTDGGGFEISAPESETAFAEDIAAAFESAGLKGGARRGESDGVSVNALCLTNYFDATRSFDPDFALTVAESLAKAVCVNTDTAFVARENTEAYGQPKKGEHGARVLILQHLLGYEGYCVNTDAYFSDKTLAALNAFQADNAVPESGHLCERTLSALLHLDCPATVPKSGVWVRYLQRKLRSKLYDVSADGFCGENTRGAVKEFLSEYGEGCDANDFVKLLSLLDTCPPRPRLY